MVERASPFPIAPRFVRDGLTIGEVSRGCLWQIAAWPDTFIEVQAALAQACGCAAPEPGQIARGARGRLVRVEPLKWWAISAEGAQCPYAPDAGQGASLDISHDQAGISIKGARSRDLLSRLVPIDLRDRSFPDGSFATTQCHHMITRVLREDEGAPAFEVLVMRSYAADLAEIVHHHAHMLD